MWRVFTVLLFFLLSPLQILAGVGDTDNRYYVTKKMWAQEPYKNFVYLYTQAFLSGGSCTAQYIAPNLILSAGHCVESKKAKYTAINYKLEEFDLALAYTEYTGKEPHGINDWAVWLVKDSKYYSDTFFDIKVPTKKPYYVINAGWGWVRILSNDEIKKIFDLIGDKSLSQDMSVEEIYKKLDKDMKKIGMESILDTKNRLKASYCDLVEPKDNSKEVEEYKEYCNELKLREQFTEEEIDKLYNEFYACIPQECRDKQAENYDSYYKCIPEDCRDKHIIANNLSNELPLLREKRIEDCELSSGPIPTVNIHQYPYVIETTCYGWQGNSGGGYVSEEGVLYGTCSFGNDTFNNHTDFMTSSLQFESKIKELREFYSTSNTAKENLKKLPKNMGIIKTNNDSNNKMLKSLDFAELEDAEQEEYTDEEIAEQIATLQKELSQNEPELIDLLKKSKDFNLSRKLQLLNDLTSHIVKSERLEKLQREYEEAKAREQSLANRTLTSATIAATGIGGMELARGLSEQKADKAAEQDMDAYIQTMRCTYGNGTQVKAGPERIELPGGNNPELMKLRAEYFALAASLKERKAALGLPPGIESEVILDKSQIGLYDDENVGITGGSYESLYRAKALGSESDQQKISEQQSASKKRVVGGAVAVGVGVVGSMVGNAIINGKNDKPNTEDKEKKEKTKDEEKPADIPKSGQHDDDNDDEDKIVAISDQNDGEEEDGEKALQNKNIERIQAKISGLEVAKVEVNTKNLQQIIPIQKDRDICWNKLATLRDNYVSEIAKNNCVKGGNGIVCKNNQQGNKYTDAEFAKEAKKLNCSDEDFNTAVKDFKVLRAKQFEKNMKKTPKTKK